MSVMYLPRNRSAGNFTIHKEDIVLKTNMIQEFKSIVINHQYIFSKMNKVINEVFNIFA